MRLFLTLIVFLCSFGSLSIAADRPKDGCVEFAQEFVSNPSKQSRETLMACLQLGESYAAAMRVLRNAQDDTAVTRMIVPSYSDGSTFGIVAADFYGDKLTKELEDKVAKATSSEEEDTEVSVVIEAHECDCTGGNLGPWQIRPKAGTATNPRGSEIPEFYKRMQQYEQIAPLYIDPNFEALGQKKY
ncbi:hypothetical protein IWQ54_001121 [Labrenzia sp. EL_195]|nr:hypothetical protein [Labrenzia sp. EL_195]